jgi:hypothetical protein
MSLPALASDFMSIVVRGVFDPTALTPRWLHAGGLISEADYRDVEIELLIPDQIFRYKTSIFNFDFQRTYLQLSTDYEQEFEGLRDVAVGILSHAADITISVLGLNRNVNISVPDYERYHRIGDTLMPKTPWEDILQIPGMRGLLIGGIRPDNYAGRIDVRVEQSVSVRPGIFIGYNDHYELELTSAQPKSRAEFYSTIPEEPASTVDKVPIAVDVLLNQWGSFLTRTTALLERFDSWGRR